MNIRLRPSTLKSVLETKNDHGKNPLTPQSWQVVTSATATSQGTGHRGVVQILVDFATVLLILVSLWLLRLEKEKWVITRWSAGSDCGSLGIICCHLHLVVLSNWKTKTQEQNVIWPYVGFKPSSLSQQFHFGSAYDGKTLDWKLIHDIIQWPICKWYMY